MSAHDIKRLENAVEMLHEMANRGANLLDAINALAEAAYTSAEIRLALDMYHWNQSKIQ